MGISGFGEVDGLGIGPQKLMNSEAQREVLAPQRVLSRSSRPDVAGLDEIEKGAPLILAAHLHAISAIDLPFELLVASLGHLRTSTLSQLLPVAIPVLPVGRGFDFTPQF
jgi:hypothetical protein